MGGKKKVKTTDEHMKSRRGFFLDLARNVAVTMAAGETLQHLIARAQDNPAGPVATLKTADHPDLAKVGGFVLLDETPEGEVLVVRISEQEFASMSTTCPHRQCHVRVASPTLIQCPCHQSAYKLDGTYVSGPSKKSLRRLVTTVKDGEITVSVP